MQPNQPFPPAQDPNQNNNPAGEPAPNQAPQSPAPDFARYQPQTPTQQPPVNDAPVSVVPSPLPVVTEPTPLVTQEAETAAPQTPPRKKSRITLIIASVVVGLLLIGGGAVAYMWVQDQNDPEKRFYRAIENHLSTTYIQQNYTQTATIANTSTIKINATSDFTDPTSPKSHIKYERSTDENDEVTNAGELAILDDTEYFAKTSTLPQFTLGGSSVDTETNQWYQIESDAFTASLVFDPMQLRKGVNVSTGEFLVGNFSESTRSELMDFIKTKNVYTIQSSEDVTVDGKKTTKYTLTIDAGLASELNEKAIKALGIDRGTKKDLVKTYDGQTNVLWVSHETNRIVKAELTRDSTGTKDDGSKITDVSTINISYPTAVPNITKPDSSDTIPWQDA